jgi:hypothetical protein
MQRWPLMFKSIFVSARGWNFAAFSCGCRGGEIAASGPARRLRDGSGKATSRSVALRPPSSGRGAFYDRRPNAARGGSR